MARRHRGDVHLATRAWRLRRPPTRRAVPTLLTSTPASTFVVRDLLQSAAPLSPPVSPSPPSALPTHNCGRRTTVSRATRSHVAPPVRFVRTATPVSKVPITRGCIAVPLARCSAPASTSVLKVRALST